MNGKLIETVIGAGYMPVISPLGSDLSEVGSGGAVNINGDDAAAAIAAALGADELLFVADVEGVMNGDEILAAVILSDVPELVEKGIVRGGMTAKLEAARAALNGGVMRVRISDIGGIMDENRGTIVTGAEAMAK